MTQPNTSESISTRPVYFLDTNAIHYALTYLEKAKTIELPPFFDSKQIVEISRAFSERIPKGIADNYVKGARILGFLIEKSNIDGDDALFYMSQMSNYEILHGNFEGKVHFKLAEAGFSYRKRQTDRDLSVIALKYLDTEDFRDCTDYLDSGKNFINDHGKIQINILEEENGRYDEISKICDFLQRNTYLDVIDSWIYACALVVQATALISSDTQLLQIVERLENPNSDPYFIHCASELTKFTNRILGFECVLPKPMKMDNRFFDGTLEKWDSITE